MGIQLEKRDFNIFRVGYAEQVAQGFKPRADTKPIKLTPPLDWNMNPLRDRNWCFQLHAWRMLQPIWAEFYGRDWARLKEEVLPWIMDWYSYHLVKERASTFMWYDMATGLRAQHLALLIHLVQEGHVLLTPDEDAMVDELSILHVKKLRDPAFISRNNHGIFQLVGLRLLGIVLSGRAELRGEEAYTSGQMQTLIESQFGPQGVHVENSPDYHNFAVTHFERIRPALFPSIANVFEGKLRAAREVGPWFTMPDGSIAAVGDSSGRGEQFSHVCSPDAESYTKWGDRVLIRDLSAGGYVVARTDLATPAYRAEMFLVKGQALSYVHAHADHLGFELFVQGRPLFVDSGKYSYNNDEWRDYFTSNRAHNVVGLYGSAFGPRDIILEKSGLEGVDFSGPQFEVNGSVYREGLTHRRRFRYTPGEELVLSDSIEAPDGVASEVYFHLADHADADISTEGEIEILAGGRFVATLYYPSSSFSATLVRGKEEAPFQGWISKGYGDRRPAVAIELKGQAEIRAWEIKIALHEPTLPTDLLQRPLPADLTIPFLYSCRADRIIPRPDNETERRVLLEYYGGDPLGIDGLLAEELKVRGFTRARARAEQGGIRAYFRSSGVRINMLIRPAETFPVRSIGAVGSVYMAITHEAGSSSAFSRE